MPQYCMTRPDTKRKDTSQVKSACSQVCGRSQPAHSCARIVLLEVFHQDNPSAKVPTYAVLDDQSTDVFVTDSLLEQLGVEDGHGPVCLDNKEDSTNCATVNRITIQRESSQNHFNVPTSNSAKEDSVVSFATRHYVKDITSPQHVREMM